MPIREHCSRGSREPGAPRRRHRRCGVRARGAGAVSASYKTAGANLGPTVGTLKIYINGVLTKTFTKSLVKDEKWEVAWVHWDAAAGTGTVEQIATTGVIVSATAMADDPLPAWTTGREPSSPEFDVPFAEPVSVASVEWEKSDVYLDVARTHEAAARADGDPWGGCSVAPIGNVPWAGLLASLLALPSARRRRDRVARLSSP